MKKKTILLVLVNLVVLAGLLYSIGLVLPKTYHVQRSVVIDAPPNVIYPHIDNLREWPEWTAWTTERYPGMTIAFGEKDQGKDAKYSWTIPNEGAGSVTLTGSSLGYGVGYSLDMDNGKHLSGGLFEFAPAEKGTRVTWSNDGHLGAGVLDRYFGLLMDRMIGPDLQIGLDKLKQKVEAEGAGQQPQAAEGQAGAGRAGAGRAGAGRGGAGQAGSGSSPPAADAGSAEPAEKAGNTEPAEKPATTEPAEKSAPAP